MAEITSQEVPQGSIPTRLAGALGSWFKNRMPSAVESEWLEAHQKIVETIKPVNAREFFIKLKDLFGLYGKVQGVSSLVADVTCAVAAAGFILANPTKAEKLRRAGIPEKNFQGFIEQVDELPSVKMVDAQNRARLLKKRSPWALSGALGVLALGPTRQVNRFAAKMAGDHVGSIVNRIVGE